MTTPALFSRVVIARIALTTIFMVPIFGGWVLYERQQERTQRVAALAAQQRQLDQQLHDAALQRRALVKLSNNVKLTSCQESNRRAKVAIEEAFQRDYQLAAAARTAGVTVLGANAFIAADMRLVIRANPTIDCSPKAIGLLPLPAVPERVTSAAPPGTVTSGPFVSRAGTTARRPPPTTAPHGRRPRPHPPHP